jgi:hypothetical protein
MDNICVLCNDDCSQCEADLDNLEMNDKLNSILAVMIEYENEVLRNTLPVNFAY